MSLEKLILQKLSRLYAERKINWLAARTGISQPTLSRAARGETDLGLAHASRLADFFNLSLVDPGMDPVEFQLVPKVKGRPVTGSSFMASDRIAGQYAFRRDFFQASGIDADTCVMFDVTGKSMQPLIMDGDAVLVDEGQKDLRDGEIFLVSLCDDLLVKRVQRTPRGWLLVSQNPDFAPMPVDACDFASFAVLGRVRWFGRLV